MKYCGCRQLYFESSDWRRRNCLISGSIRSWNNDFSFPLLGIPLSKVIFHTGCIWRNKQRQKRVLHHPFFFGDLDYSALQQWPAILFSKGTGAKRGCIASRSRLKHSLNVTSVKNILFLQQLAQPNQMIKIRQIKKYVSGRGNYICDYTITIKRDNITSIVIHTTAAVRSV